MKLIKFKTVTGKTVWVNPEWVVGVHAGEDGIQIITGEGDDAFWFVEGKLDEVAEMLERGS